MSQIVYDSKGENHHKPRFHIKPVKKRENNSLNREIITFRGVSQLIHKLSKHQKLVITFIGYSLDKSCQLLQQN